MGRKTGCVSWVLHQRSTGCALPGQILMFHLKSIVNNAGISIESSKPAAIQDTSDETYDTTMRVNAKSVFLGCKYAAKQMITQEPWAQTGDRGWIINVSSIAGLIGLRAARVSHPFLNRFIHLLPIWCTDGSLGT